MVVQEVQMLTWQPRDLGKGVVHPLCVEAAAACEECVLVTEGAVVRAAARHHDRVRHQVAVPLNQIPADRRDALERADCRHVPPLRPASRQVVEEPGKGVFAGPEHDRVRVRGCLVRKRRDVQSPEHHVGTAGAVVIRDAVGPVGIGDVDLNDDEIGVILEVERFDVLVLDRDGEVRVEVCRQGREPEGRKQ